MIEIWTDGSCLGNPGHGAGRTWYSDDQRLVKTMMPLSAGSGYRATESRRGVDSEQHLPMDVARPDGGREAGVSIFVRPGFIELSYASAPDGSCVQTRGRVSLVAARHGRHGQRVWFACAGCQRRSAMLHTAGSRFRCRCCERLRYASQYRQRIRSYGRYHGWVGG